MAKYNINFKKLKCKGTTDYEWGSDEPYFIFLMMDWNDSRLASNNLLPYVRVKRTKKFGDVDAGETHSQTKRLWGPKPYETWANIDSVLKQMIIVQAMEHDKSPMDDICDLLEKVMRAIVPIYLVYYNLLPQRGSTEVVKENRGKFRRKIKSWMYKVIDGKIWVPSRGEIRDALIAIGDPITGVGWIKLAWWALTRDIRIQANQLVIRRAELNEISSGGSKDKTLTHKGAGAEYKTYYTIKKQS